MHAILVYEHTQIIKMAALKTSSLILMDSYVSSKPKQILRGSIIKASINISNSITNINSLSPFQTIGLSENEVSPIINHGKNNEIMLTPVVDPLVMAKLYTIMEAVADRIEMHRNIGDQRADWNRLLLSSINALNLSAATMAGIASISGGVTALKLSCTVLYVAAIGLLSVMNKIQPSQLAEEQRNAARLFEQIQNQIRTLVSIGNPTDFDVEEMMGKVLALDQAYPLPLLGAMLEKFPENVEPAVWWPERRRKPATGNELGFNGWNRELEEELREISDVIRTKDEEDYLRLGGRALRLNKILAIAGPMLTGLAAVGSALPGGWGTALGIMGGALASAVNALEHGGQVGMVFEMYRSNAGFFKMVEESIVGNLREEEPERRENGEVFEMKVALQLGRSLSELSDLAAKRPEPHQFASKLF